MTKRNEKEFTVGWHQSGDVRERLTGRVAIESHPSHAGQRDTYHNFVEGDVTRVSIQVPETSDWETVVDGDNFEFAAGWDRERLAYWATLSRRFHLSDMNAGCAHMIPAPTGTRCEWGGFVIGAMDSPDPVRRWDSTMSVPTLSHYTVNRALECPESGYRYGSAWLVATVPDEVVAEVVALIAEQPRSKSGLEELVEQNGITMTAEYASSNPNMDGPERDQMDHWKCVLLMRADGRRQFTIYFSMGVGHEGREPTVTEVLESVASDAAGFENAHDFESWCGEYGYDTDSRSAEKSFKTIERHTKKLRTFLGRDLFEALLWKTERE